MFNIGGLVTGGLGSLFSIGSSLFNNAKANRLAKESVRPTYEIPDEIGLNQKMAGLDATKGMGGTEYNNALNGINRNTSAGLDTLSKDRNSLAGVGNLVAQANDATLNLNAQNDAIHRQNKGALYDANNNMAQYMDKAFQYNKADKYKQEQDIIAQLRGAAGASLGNGVNGLSGLGMAAFMSQNNNKNN
jgi:hypothetical protein